jgi:hypothetical protein
MTICLSPISPADLTPRARIRIHAMKCENARVALVLLTLLLGGVASGSVRADGLGQYLTAWLTTS